MGVARIGGGCIPSFLHLISLCGWMEFFLEVFGCAASLHGEAAGLGDWNIEPDDVPVDLVGALC